MPRGMKGKAALTALIVAAAIAGRRDEPYLAFFLASLGVLNVWLQGRGTVAVRAAALAASLFGLVWRNDDVAGAVTILAWLVWVPAYLLAAAIDTARPLHDHLERRHERATPQQVTLAGVIAAVAVASGAYRLLVMGNLQQTAALFIGIPSIIAIVVVLAVAPTTATGVAIKAVTIGLLLSLVLLWEGVLCVAMAAPLFYFVAIVIGAFVDMRRARSPRSSTRLMGIVLLIAAPMTLEGVTPMTTLDRVESVAVTRVVHASASQVEHAIFLPPRFDRPQPAYLRAGFPRVVSTRIDEHAMRWVMRVRGGEMRLNGMEPRTGELTLVLDERRPGMVRWRSVSDTSHTTHFLRWRFSMVEWRSIDADTTQVTWTLGYERGLDPAWYFGPMERYGVRLAAEYLIEAVATP